MIDFSFLKDLLSPLSKLVEFVSKLIRGHHPALLPVPKKTIILVALPQHYSCHWGMASQESTPGMYIVARFHVTNISRYEVEIPLAHLRRWFKKTTGNVFVWDQESDFYGMHPIPPGGSSEIDADFFVAPPFKEKGESFTADVIFTDQFRNNHTVWRVRFKYLS